MRLDAVRRRASSSMSEPFVGDGPPASFWAKWGAHSAGMTLAVRVPHGIRHTRAPRYQAESESPGRTGATTGHALPGRQGGSVSSPDDVPRGRVRSPPCRGDRGGGHSHRRPAPPERRPRPRRSRRQLPDATPPSILAPSAILDASEQTKRSGPMTTPDESPTSPEP